MFSLVCSWLRLGSSPSPTSKTDPCPDDALKSPTIVEKADVPGGETADAKTEKAQWLIQTIVDTHSALLKLPHLRPDKTINHLLGNLVTVCCDIYDREIVDQVLHHPSIQAILPSLRHVCAQAESCLEAHWAERILHPLSGDTTTATAGGRGRGREDHAQDLTVGGQDPDRDDANAAAAAAVLARLQRFPYYDNYEELVRLELCAIRAAAANDNNNNTSKPPARIAFIGSGPLPLSALCLLGALRQGQHSEKPHGEGRLLAVGGQAQEARPPGGPGGAWGGGGDSGETTTPLMALNIDCDPAAIAASRRLCAALGEHGRGMEFLCEQAEALGRDGPDGGDRDLGAFDVVYLAALVGMSQAEKEAIVLGVAARMRAGALLVVRSSWGLRTCLYPEVDLATERLLRRLRPCVVVHPYGRVVNSVVVARVGGR